MLARVLHRREVSGRPAPSLVAPFARRLAIAQEWTGHAGCVNSVIYSHSDPSRIAISGSDDRKIHLWNAETGDLLHSVRSGHAGNVFSAHDMGSCDTIVSCAADGTVRVTRLNATGHGQTRPPAFECHKDMTYMAMPEPNSPHVFYSCAEDGYVMRYDLRAGSSCSHRPSYTDEASDDSCHTHTFINYRKVLAERRPGNKPAHPTPASRTSRLLQRLLGTPTECGVSCIAIRADHILATATNDDRVSLFDKRNPAQPFYQYTLDPHSVARRRFHVPHKITDLRWEDLDTGGNLLVSFSEGDLALLQPSPDRELATGDEDVVRRYYGHRNAQTMIKEANFLGTQAIMSGSDDGHLFVWDRKSGRLLSVTEADGRILNCVQPHPHSPHMPILCSGIDDTIKVMQPILDHPQPEIDPDHVGVDTEIEQLVASNMRARTRSMPFATEFDQPSDATNGEEAAQESEEEPRPLRISVLPSVLLELFGALSEGGALIDPDNSERGISPSQTSSDSESGTDRSDDSDIETH